MTIVSTNRYQEGDRAHFTHAVTHVGSGDAVTPERVRLYVLPPSLETVAYEYGVDPEVTFDDDLYHASIPLDGGGDWFAQWRDTDADGDDLAASERLELKVEASLW